MSALKTTPGEQALATPEISASAGATECTVEIDVNQHELSPASDVSPALSPQSLSSGHIYSTYWDASTGWPGGWFEVPGGGGTQPLSIVATLARNPNHLDLFVIGTDGVVYSTYWDVAGGWSTGWFGLPGTIAPQGATITAIARTPDNIDLFVTDGNGETSWTTWNDAGWTGSWTDLGGGTMPGSPIAANSRYPNRIDLFCFGEDRSVYSRYWDTSWTDWLRNPCPTGLPGTVIAAVGFETDYIGLYFTGDNGSIYGNTFYMEPTPADQWFEVPGGMVVKPGSPVTAIARDSVHVDLFVTGTDGVIYTTSWGSSGNPIELWLGYWIPIPGIYTTEGAMVTAVSRYPTHTDIFVTDVVGRICSTWWDESVGWTTNPWFVVANASDSRPAAPVSVVSRNPNHLDLFVVG